MRHPIENQMFVLWPRKTVHVKKTHSNLSAKFSASNPTWDLGWIKWKNQHISLLFSIENKFIHLNSLFLCPYLRKFFQFLTCAVTIRHTLFANVLFLENKTQNLMHMAWSRIIKSVGLKTLSKMTITLCIIENCLHCAGSWNLDEFPMDRYLLL